MCLYFAIQLFSLILAIIGTSDAIICYKCDSMTNPQCAMSLDGTDLDYEECKTDLNCIMSIVESVTYRGCNSNTPTIEATYKKSCTTNLCNKGVYPPGRLKCYHCAGPDCIDKPSGKPHPCLSHHEEDACYTQVSSSTEVQRGCRSDANHTESDLQVEYCEINGCNDKPGISSLKCAKCDSISDRGCKLDLLSTTQAKCNITQYEQCEMDVPLSSNKTCFLYHNLNRVVRGCTQQIPEEIEMDIEHRKECSNGDFCNTDCLEQQKCIVCDSTKNKDCLSDTSTIPLNVCGSAEVSSCHACEYNDWHVERGCGSPPSISATINRCYECSPEAGCNEKPLTRCYKCSSEGNANCANWERPGTNIDIEECQHPGSPCIIAAFSNGVIERGCHGSSLNCNDSLISCHQCSGSFCNKNRYPPNRLRCFQCEGNEECALLENDPMPCLQTTQNSPDACFEFYDTENGGMVRGCRSNAELYYRCIFYNAGKSCRVCYEDGCNNSPATTISTLLCYKCGKATNNCEETQKDDRNLQQCSNAMPFGYNDNCYTTRHLDGSTSRGCTLDEDREINIWDQTEICSKDGCNFLPTV